LKASVNPTGDKTMSAFIVSEDTMHRVMNILDRRAHYLGCFRDTDFGKTRSVEALAGRLQSINVQAVNSYYDDGQEAEPYRHKTTFPVSDIVGYKAVQCLLYQCSEGDVPDTPLFKELRNFMNGLASLIISDLPAYRDAPWD
jgi:hypothetical protein